MKQRNVILLVGYPGSGKGTQGPFLSQLTQLEHISTGNLFRAEAQSGSEVGKQMDSFMQQGKIVPAEIVLPYLKSFLQKKRGGYILDGYPKSKEFYTHLVDEILGEEQGIKAVLYLKVDREVAKQRLATRKNCSRCDLSFLPSESKCNKCGAELAAREDDEASVVEKRLDSFEASTEPLLKIYRDTGVLYEIDGSKSPEEVSQAIKEALEVASLPYGSYIPSSFDQTEKSSVFHGHLDAKDHFKLIDAVMAIDEPYKIYPVSHLYLGKQCPSEEFKGVYGRLPNFHSIDNAKTEAFGTLKMGTEGVDYNAVTKVLNHLNGLNKEQKVGFMTEIEEELYAAVFKQGSKEPVPTLDRKSNYEMDWTKLPPNSKERMINNVPKYELHHGFDVVKTSKDEGLPPVPLDKLMADMQNNGFSLGGIFIFRKEGLWAYRTNEFSNESYQECLDKLVAQGKWLNNHLQGLVQTEVGISLEKVHAIWSFDD